jgi:hypothetical protein
MCEAENVNQMTVFRKCFDNESKNNWEKMAFRNKKPEGVGILNIGSNWVDIELDKSLRQNDTAINSEQIFLKLLMFFNLKINP